VDPADAEKTGSSAGIGLCNAGATFQRLMDLVMTGLAFDVCLYYLDDVIIFSFTLEEHFQRLRMVLTRLIETGLKLKPSKCRLLQKEVVLGTLCRKKESGLTPRRSVRLQSGRCPRTCEKLEHFWDCAVTTASTSETSRRFVHRLHALTRKGAKFDWCDGMFV